MEKKMMSADALNKAYETFKTGAISKKDFEGRMFQYLIENRQKFGYHAFSNNDDYVDFLCGSYSEISHSLDRYVPVEGVPFDVYLCVMARYIFRRQKSKESRQKKLEGVFWDDCARDSRDRNEDDSPEAASLPGDAGQAAMLEMLFATLTPRQRLIFLLKVYNQISEDLVENAAPLLNCTHAELSELIESMRNLRKKRDARKTGLKERCYRQHYRCLAYEAQLAASEKNSGQYKNISLLLEKGRLRLSKMRLRLSRIRTEASNKQVAEMLGIPKGSVDSAVFSIQKKLRSRHGALLIKFFPRFYQSDTPEAPTAPINQSLEISTP
jgi:DNA-directed RNA polymerase specialized sigma24 family protein